MRTIQITERDTEILEILTQKIRVLTCGQIARTFWPDTKSPEDGAKARLVLLAAADFVLLRRALAHPELHLVEPVASWRVGNVTPEFGPVSYKLQRRWSRPPVLTLIASATRRASNPRRSPQIRPFLVTQNRPFFSQRQDIRCYNPAR
jgi:hypothetical protein